MRALRYLPLLFVIACGDNIGVDDMPDAKRADAAPDAPMPVPCSYDEAADATNDTKFGGGTNMAENTGIMFGSSAVGVCGKLDSSHYNAGRQLIDADAFQLHVSADTTVLLYVTAPGAEAYDAVLIEIANMVAPRRSEVGKFFGTFAMASAQLPPGDYQIYISAFNGTAAAADLDYKLVLAPDNAAARCPKMTGTATYTEALDGASNDGNDIYIVNYTGGTPRDFTSASDVVEPTGISVAPSMSYHVAGSSGTPGTNYNDFYLDRDTYQITMGPNANQLSLRLNWSATTADFDVLVFPMGLLSDFAEGYYNRSMEDEFVTTAVTPGMSYWVFVGADTTSTGQPLAYDLSVCGGTFTAP